MPELPEVETTVRDLRHKLVGKKIKDVVINDTRLLQDPSPLLGKTVENLTRRGKWMVFHLEDDLALLAHLRLTGSFIINGNRDHKRGEITFTDNTHLGLFDPRGFATWRVDTKTAIFERLDSILSQEPIEDSYTAEYFSERLGNTKRTIKACLLDQKIAAGMGNIYTDEVLWACKIHPLTRADTLTKANKKCIVKHMRELLLKSIERGGSSVRDYVRGTGQEGENQKYLHVYNRKGKPCARCHHQILHTKVAGRGTYYCPYCQKEPQSH